MAKQQLVPYIHTDGKEWEHYFVDPASRRADVGGFIYFMKSHGGKKIKFSTRVREPFGPKAKAFANKEFDKRTGKHQRFVRTLIKEEVDSWLLIKEGEGHAYDTMNNVRRAARQIKEYWGDRLPNEITRDSLAEWYAWWKLNHPDIEMTNVVKYMRNFSRYLHEKVVGDRPLLASVPTIQDPNRKAIKAKRAKKKERVFTEAEVSTVLTAAANSEDALVALIMNTMATRIEETLSLKFGESILLDQAIPTYRWTIGQNKTDSIGEHALHPSLLEPLKALRSRRKLEGTALLFPQRNDNQKALKTQQIDWDGWRKRAALDWHWTAHTFRHTCLTMLFNNPSNPHAVICKLYRVSLQVALDTYVKVTAAAMLAIRDSINVTWEFKGPGSSSESVANSVRLSVDPLLGIKIGVPKGI